MRTLQHSPYAQLLHVPDCLTQHDMATTLQGFGYAVSLAGFGWYNQIKLQQPKPSEYSSLPTMEKPARGS